ncbi:MAG: hypothetical protein HS111_13340 [Kofleriaceae bacterium]|nr:hypothetical protein [Kofleriaceae bacterium]
MKEFLVSPALPPALSRLSEMANNLLWSWEFPIRKLPAAGPRTDQPEAVVITILC